MVLLLGIAPALFHKVNFTVKLRKVDHLTAVFPHGVLDKGLDILEVRLVEQNPAAAAPCQNVSTGTLKVGALAPKLFSILEALLKENLCHSLECAVVVIKPLMQAIGKATVKHWYPLFNGLVLIIKYRVSVFIKDIDINTKDFAGVLGHIPCRYCIGSMFEMDGCVIVDKNVAVIWIVAMKNGHCMLKLLYNIVAIEPAITSFSSLEENLGVLSTIRRGKPAIVWQNKICNH